MTVKCINLELSQDVSILLHFFIVRMSFSLQSHSAGGKPPSSLLLVSIDARNCKNVINVVC